MKPDPSSIQKHAAWIRWAAVVIPLLLFYGIASTAGPSTERPGFSLVFTAGGILFSGAMYWLVNHWLLAVEAQGELAAQSNGLEALVTGLRERIEMMLRINSRLVEAQDEQGLMQSILELLGNLVGASALSYIPLDEWGQPLASVIHGDVTPDLLEKWKSHLVDPAVMDTCKNCQVLHTRRGESCPLAGHPFTETEGIACLRVFRGEKLLGIVNLYRPDPQPLDTDTRKFLDSLLQEIALAVETLRLRNQEMMTLRQIQMVRTPDRDLVNQLNSLLVGTQQALEVDYAILTVRGTPKIPSLFILGKGSSSQLKEEAFKNLLEQVYHSDHLITQVAGSDSVLPGEVGALLAAPISLPGGPVVGAILVANHSRQAFYPRQLRVLETVTAQAAVLVDHEQQILDLEYRAIIEERTRLAREIHDGLAQTLAFLKMQVSQMQNYLARDDTERLREVLSTTHQTLSEAYQDARQAIDHLRIAPNEGVKHWLGLAVEDFQDATSIPSQLTIQPNLTDLPPEIQAQLVRVVQEALNNIRKHSRATQVQVSLHRWKNDIILEIQDNGEGFSPEDVPTISQYGLRGMRERAELIGADFQIVSQPNGGTIVRLRLPAPLEETPV